MNSRYKVQYREAHEKVFRDASDSMTCEECIATMRKLFSESPERDFQIIDERRHVIASTLVDGTQESSS